MRESIATAASGARLIAAILLALGGLRFAMSAVVGTIEASAPELSPPALPVRSAPAPIDAAPPPPAAAGAPAIASGTPARPTLSVSAGAPRSDVFVNGVLVGKTPFLGEVSCKTGSPVKIEVVQSRGAPLRHTVACASGNIVIDR